MLIVRFSQVPDEMAAVNESFSFRLLWMPLGPNEICENQNDDKSAPSLELLKEAGQYVTEYKYLKTGQQS
jgi:hypothetical protein